MGNKKISMEFTARSFGPLLVITAYADTQSIIKEVKKFDTKEKIFGETFIEIIYFYINITDRFAFAYLGDPKRHQFFDVFLEEVFKNYLDGYKNTSGEVDEVTFYNIFNESQKERQLEYGAYKYPIKNGFGTKEDLVYHFANKLAEILGGKDDVLIIAHIWIIFMASIKKYHELFEKFMSEISIDKQVK